ncbi:MAG: ABC transporter ATP-binding protein [Sulfolobaceae archaeon]|nr:ABC transporter ATP-binding protein [Sulfolobaceae archaeon]
MVNDCIVVRNVVKKYDNLVALNNLSFTIPCGGRYALLGPNGAGKSTTLKILAGLLKPDYGEVYIMGHKPGSVEVKRVMGFLPEDPLPYPNLTVRENLEFIASLRGIPNVKDKVEELMELLDLKEYEKVLTGKLSRGNRQKLSIALAIMHEPKIVLLDEPLNYLDIPSQEKVISLLKKMNSTFLISTHIMSIATRLTDHVIVIAKGTMVWEGTIEELRLFSKEEDEPIESIVSRLMENVR